MVVWVILNYLFTKCKTYTPPYVSENVVRIVPFLGRHVVV